MGMGIKHGIGNGMEWETTSMGMGITYIPVGIYSHSILLRLRYSPSILSTSQGGGDNNGILDHNNNSFISFLNIKKFIKCKKMFIKNLRVWIFVVTVY